MKVTRDKDGLLCEVSNTYHAKDKLDLKVVIT